MWSVAAPRNAQTPQKKDPAPTRWSYRYQRLMLTPLFRKAVTRWLPICAVVAGLGLWAVNQSEQISEAMTGLRDTIATRPEFMISAMAVQGADQDLQRDIRAVLPLHFPVSQFDLDLTEMRNTVVALDGVKTASLMVGAEGILEMQVVPRVPVAVWRDIDGLKLVDETGTFVGTVPFRTARADLPLVAGQGADVEIAEAMHLIAALGPMETRLRGLERLGERRWDIVLDRDQRIMLPADNPVPTLERIVALAQASDLLERDVVAVDMRVPRRPTLRMTEGAAETLRETRFALTEAE